MVQTSCRLEAHARIDTPPHEANDLIRRRKRIGRDAACANLGARSGSCHRGDESLGI
jgi:hypothetical protein